MVIILALSGFSLSYYIHQTKKKQAPLVCPLDGSCDEVMQSKYSVFLGIPLTLLGMIYYGVTTLHYFGLFVSFIPYTPLVSFMLSMVSFGAFLFSLYLTSVQGFVLHKWCTWCLFSASFSTLIAIGGGIIAHQSFIPFLINNLGTMSILFTIFLALGVGATTVLDVMFFKALKDYRISNEEAENFHTLSQVLWFALGLVVLSGLMVYTGDSATAGQTSKFLLELCVAGVIAINAVALNLIVSPRLTSISFGNTYESFPQQSKYLRHLAFLFGSVSVVSWYFIFVLNLIQPTVFSFRKGIEIYGVVVVFAIIISLLLNQYFLWERKHSAYLS